MDGKLYLPTVVQNSISGIETGIQISVQWRELFFFGGGWEGEDFCGINVGMTNRERVRVGRRQDVKKTRCVWGLVGVVCGRVKNGGGRGGGGGRMRK